MTEERFDQLLNEIREESAPEEQAESARERVRQKLNGSGSAVPSPARKGGVELPDGLRAVCAEFFGDREAYLARTLSESRRLLMDDHLSRCPECRRAIADVQAGVQRGARNGSRNVLGFRTRSRPATWARWAAAAAVVLGGVFLGRDKIDVAFAPSGPAATVMSVSGGVYVLPQKPLQAGAALAPGDVVRTTAGSRALLQLADGSRVEMNQRTELNVRAAWSGLTVRLGRGDVMVEAAKQRRGHLRVITHDSTASVKGTVFGVSSDTEGTMVSVVEGSVDVSQPGGERLLASGEKSATNPALQKLEVRQAISWSQDAQKYYSLLAQFRKVGKEIEAAPGPALRYEAKLLRYIPAGTEVYLAIPNLNGTIRQALFQFEQSARESAVLNEWWSSPQARAMRDTLDRVQAVTPYLGDEVVLVFGKSPGGKSPGDHEQALILAEIQPGRQEALEEGITRIANGGPSIAHKSTGNLLVISPAEPQPQGAVSLNAQLGGGASSAFAQEIASRYQNGVGWLAGVDLAGLTEAVPEAAQRLLGTPNMRYLFLEQRSVNGEQRSANGDQRSANGGEDTEATLSFEGARTGIASWLAPPGSAGSVEYVSANAMMVFSASTRDPRQAFEELLTGDGDFPSAVRKFESDTGVSVGSDVASALGTDFAFSIEQPTMPMPGWVGIAEVVRPDLLDETMRRLVDSFNRTVNRAATARERDAQQITLTRESVNGRSWSSLKIPGPITLYWTYDRGYLIASTDRGLATRAIAIRDSGSSLAHSSTFQLSFPASGGIHHSGFVWINTNGALTDLAQLVPDSPLHSLLAQTEPVLLVMDGETERIHAASRTRLTSMILNLLLSRAAGRGPAPPVRAGLSVQ